MCLGRVKMTKIELLDGKYTVQHDNGTNFKALRYGEEWRDLTGDGLVLALVQRIEELQEEIEDINYRAWELSLGESR